MAFERLRAITFLTGWQSKTASQSWSWLLTIFSFSSCFFTHPSQECMVLIMFVESPWLGSRGFHSLLGLRVSLVIWIFFFFCLISLLKQTNLNCVCAKSCIEIFIINTTHQCLIPSWVKSIFLIVLQSPSIKLPQHSSHNTWMCIYDIQNQNSTVLNTLWIILQ